MKGLSLNRPLSGNAATVYLLITAVLWSISGVFTKLIDWNPVVIAGLRSFICALVFLIYLRGFKRIVISKQSILGGLCNGSTVLLYITATKLTTSANAVVLQYTCPIWIIVIGAVFLRHRYKPGDYLAVLVSIVGVALCFLDDLQGGQMLGNGLALLAGLTMGLQFLVFANNKSIDTSFSAVFLGQVFAFAVSIPFIIFEPPVLTTLSVVSILILGVIQLGIPYILYSIAMKYSPPLKASLILMAEPILTPIWVAIVIREVPGPWAFVGAIVVFGAVAVWTIWNGRKPKANTEVES